MDMYMTVRSVYDTCIKACTKDLMEVTVCAKIRKLLANLIMQRINCGCEIINNNKL